MTPKDPTENSQGSPRERPGTIKHPPDHPWRSPCGPKGRLRTLQRPSQAALNRPQHQRRRPERPKFNTRGSKALKDNENQGYSSFFMEPQKTVPGTHMGAPRPAQRAPRDHQAPSRASLETPLRGPKAAYDNRRRSKASKNQ